MCARVIACVCARMCVRACVHVMVLLEADGQSKQTFDEIETRVMDCGRAEAAYEETSRKGQTGAGQRRLMKRQTGEGQTGAGQRRLMKRQTGVSRLGQGRGGL